MDLSELRKEINSTDEKLLDLFARRMEISERIATYKQEHGLPVYDAAREAEKLQAAENALPEALRGYGAAFTEVLMDLGKSWQYSTSGSAEDKNIVLIGMPGAGKSTIGGIISEMTGKELAEPDFMIEDIMRQSIPEIFAQYGELFFRHLETAVLSAVCRRKGIVISTGGGVITRPENFPLLKSNGVIFWLLRDVDKLDVTGRPLSMAADLNEMYKVRSPLYRRFADFAADNNGKPEEAAEEVLRMFRAANKQ